MEYYDSFESSNIKSIAYEVESSTLQVTFHNGTSYQYFEVPEQAWQSFKGAESQGQYFNGTIKGHYRYSRL